jgi:hypothetical protein
MQLIFTVYTQMRLSCVCECVCYIKRFIRIAIQSMTVTVWSQGYVIPIPTCAYNPSGTTGLAHIFAPRVYARSMTKYMTGQNSRIAAIVVRSMLCLCVCSHRLSYDFSPFHRSFFIGRLFLYSLPTDDDKHTQTRCLVVCVCTQT